MIAEIFVKNKAEYVVFVFVGLTAWDYFNKNVTASVKIVKNNRAIVSKIYIPKGYDIGSFYEGIASFKEVMDHFKYTNNYDYNKSIYLINADKHYDNGFLLLKEDQRFASPLAVVFYEEYEDLSDLYTSLQAQADKIQCIVTDEEAIIDIPCFKFGCSQAPALSDYADGVNTLDFLFSNV